MCRIQEIKDDVTNTPIYVFKSIHKERNIKMAKELLVGNGWTQKTVRLKTEYHKICDFLLFLCNSDEEVQKRKMFNEIFRFSLDYLLDKKDKIEIEKFKGRREPKGFLLEDKTIETLEKEYKVYKDHFKKESLVLSKGEFYELMLYIYCKNNLKDYEKFFLDSAIENKWGYIELK